jgi:hypothetical protein
MNVLRRGGMAVLLILCAAGAIASVGVSPGAVSIYPTQTSGTVNVTLIYPAPTFNGTGIVNVTGMPAGVTTSPSPITYSFTSGVNNSSTSFQFVAASGVTPGSYALSVADATSGASSTRMNLTILAPTYNPSVAPNPLTLPLGSTQNVTVQTNPDPGFTATVSYTFNGLPPFISFGGAQSAPPPYAPRTFPFSLGAGATPGTYTGSLTATIVSAAGAPVPKTVPFTVTIPTPDFNISLLQPVQPLCAGGPQQSNGISISGINGYSGTPSISFTGVPAGITLTPPVPTASAMPPNQTVPFNVSASSSVSGTVNVTVNVSDGPAGINKSTTLTLNVTQPDYAPSVSPPSVNLIAGGASQSMNASLAPNSCFGSTTVTVTPSIGQPGITFAPPSATISGPAAPPATFSVSAAAGVPPATYSASFVYTMPGGATKTVPASITVALPPDFSLAAVPSSVTLTPGASASVTVSATGINGYSGTVNVTAPSVPNVTFTPSNFTISVGSSQSVTVTASGAAGAGSFPSSFTATAPAIAGTRSAPFTTNITPAPDFSLNAAPSSVTLTPGNSTTITLSANGINGFSGSVNVTAPVIANVTFAPANFTVTAGSSQVVTITAAPGAPPASVSGNFSGTAAGISGTRTAPMTVTIGAAPDFSISVAPPGVTLTPGNSATVTLSSAAINGFSGSINVAAPAIPNVTFAPANFTIPAGGTQTITITAAAGAPPSSGNGNFSGSAAGISGTRTTPIGVTINPAPDFSLSIAPPSVTVAAGGSTTVTLSSVALNGFSGTINVTAPSIPNVTFTPSNFTLAAGASQTITVAGASPSSGSGNFSGTAAGISGSRTTPISVTVSAAPDFSISAAPASVTVTHGGASASVVVNASGINGFAGTITVNAPPIAGVTFTPATFTFSPGGSQTVAVSAPSGTSPNVYSGSFSATAAGISGTRTTPISVTVVAPATYTLTLQPLSTTIAAGQTVNGSLTAVPSGGFSSPVAITIAQPAGFTVTPASFTLTPGVPQSFAVASTPAVPVGIYSIGFAALGGGITRSAAMTINVTAAPDATISVTPGSVTLAAGGSSVVTVSAIGLNGFAGTLNVSAPTVNNLTFSPVSFTLAPGASQPVTITASAAAGAIATGDFTATSPLLTGTRTATLTTIVSGAGGDFSLVVTPASLTFPSGGSTAATVTLIPIGGFAGSANVTASAPFGVTVTPSSFALSANAPKNVTVGGSGNGGLVTFSATSGALTHSQPVSVAITPAVVTDFQLTATPQAFALRPGETAPVTLAVTSQGAPGLVTIKTPQSADVTFAPSTLTVNGSGSVTTVATITAGATAKSVALTFTATAANLAAPRTATSQLTIRARPPVIRSIAPQAATIGTRSLVVHLNGSGFRPAAIVTATGGLLLEQTNVISGELADVTLSVPQKSAPGPVTLALTNPDGGRATTTLLLYPSSSLGAPLGVTAAAIVYPRAGAIIGSDDAVVPRALLATSGTGTITGVWKFDGAAYDTFTTPVTGGAPVTIEAHVPIPHSFNGDHTLALEVQAPQHALSPLVSILQADRSASQLRILEPLDGVVMLDGPRFFRWSLVPGALAYAIEVERSERELPLQLRTTESTYALRDPATWGVGLRRWRVRPIFPGDVRGQATEWRRIAILPHELTLRFLAPEHDAKSGRLILRWTGGVAGALYHVTFYDPKGEIFFSALTADQSYKLPATQKTLPPGTTVRVTAFGPEGKPIGSTGDKPFASMSSNGAMSGPAFAQVVVPVEPQLTSRLPEDGSSVPGDRPRIEAKWSRAVGADQVTMVIDKTDVTAVSLVEPTAIAYDSLLPLSAGEHEVKLAVGGTLASWKFTVLPQAVTPADTISHPGMTGATPVAPLSVDTTPAPVGVATPAEPIPPPPPRVHGDWLITPLGTLTVLSGSGVPGGDAIHGQLSAQSDIAAGPGFTKMTGDTALKHDLNNPGKTVQESRNWVGRFGGDQFGGKVHEEAIVGFAAPDFFDRAELLTMGLSRGGWEAKVRLPYGTASYYETVDLQPVGAVSGNVGTQNVRAFAYEFPATQKLTFRLVNLNVVEKQSLYGVGGKGSALGIVASYAFTPLASFFAEVAHGKFAPNQGDERTQGNALRAGLTGSAGTFSYVANVRRTESTYINPANRGFTQAGIPDRTGADLQVSKMFGKTSLSAQVRHQHDGATRNATIARTKENAIAVTLARALTQRTQLSTTGTWTRDDGTSTEYSPATRRVQRGLSATLNEMLGRITLTQTVTRQELIDSINRSASQNVSTANLGITGNVWRQFSLSTFVSFTRSEGPLSGTNDQTVYTIQPSYAVPRFWITFAPRASYSRGKNGLYGTLNTNEQYQALMSFAPPWLASLASLQFATDWTHNAGTNMPATAYTRRYTGTMNFKWGVGHGALDPRPQPVQTNPAAVPAPTQ